MVSSYPLLNSKENPIEIDDDSDTAPFGRTQRQKRPRLMRTLRELSSASDRSETIANDPDEQCALSTRSHETSEVIDLTEELGRPFRSGEYLTNERISRAAGIPHGRSDQHLVTSRRQRYEPRAIPVFYANDSVYTAGESVELHDGTFLRIVQVFQEPTGQVFLNGNRFVRLEDLDPRYPNWTNELCWIINETSDGRMPEDVSLNGVKQFRIIHLTNSRYPSMSYGKSGASFPSDDAAKGELYCRLKEVTVSTSTRETLEVAIEYLAETEADDGYMVPPSLLRQTWRGSTEPFGSAEKPRYDMPDGLIDLDGTADAVIDLTQPDPPARQNTRQNTRQYTFGDGFCGAGGVSRGALQAGLSIKWAFDKSAPAIQSYSPNFDGTVCEIADITSFLTNNADELKVDVSHGSPPCQTFSPAHTVNSANDDANSACIFSCRDLVERAKPRVHTMEETSGLLERHKETFFAVIQDYVEIGYSVRWKVLDCAHYGVPQSRKRLLIIASGPGEVLPKFPKPSHGESHLDLLPYTTIEMMISKIPRNAPDHDVAGALERGRRNGFKRPFDPQTQAKTITCGGGEGNHHPSGKRGFTNREFACLQTFPQDHRFGPREVRRQIGNAVPPVVAKALYREVIKSLRKTDEAELRAAESERRGIGAGL